MNIQRKAPLLLQLIDLAFKSSEDEDDKYMNLVIHSSSSSDEEDEAIMHTILNVNKSKKLNKIPRLEGFVERVIPRYTAQEFKKHFRYVIFILIDIQLIAIKI